MIFTQEPSQVLTSTYRPEDGDTGEADPAIHLLVQHGADTNKKDRCCHVSLDIVSCVMCVM